MLIAAIGIAAAVWWARAPFVAATVVPIYESRIGGIGPLIGDEQVWIRCELDTSSKYVFEDGSPYMTHLDTSVPTRAPADPYCEAARRDRIPTAAAIAVLAFGLAALVVAADQASRRRAIDRGIEAMAAERAAAGSPPPEPVTPSDAGSPDP